MNAKDDYMLVEKRIRLSNPYFGNCSYGQDFEKENYPKDENGDIDWDKLEREGYPNFLVLHTGRG